MHTICFVLSFLLCRAYSTLFALHGVRSTLLFDIPCIYWNWLNPLQTDNKRKRRGGIKSSKKERKKERSNVLQTHIVRTNKISMKKRENSRAHTQKQIRGEKCWTIVIKETARYQKFFHCCFVPASHVCWRHSFSHTLCASEAKKTSLVKHAIALHCCLIYLLLFFFGLWELRKQNGIEIDSVWRWYAYNNNINLSVRYR